MDVWARRVRVPGGSGWCKGPEVLGCTEEVWESRSLEAE